MPGDLIWVSADELIVAIRSRRLTESQTSTAQTLEAPILPKNSLVLIVQSTSSEKAPLVILLTMREVLKIEGPFLHLSSWDLNMQSMIMSTIVVVSTVHTP